MGSIVVSRWFFGYGSLIWRPFEPHIQAHPGTVVGWVRRFWQGSPDHRGTPDDPGRVVTLVPDPGAHCVGLCFEVGRDHVEEALRVLDHREKAGYERHCVEVTLHDGTRVHDALMYVAGSENPDYLGEANLDEIARHVLRAHGPSGSNLRYLEDLVVALKNLGAGDPHVSGLASRVERLQGK